MRKKKRFLITERNEQSFSVMDKKTKQHLLIASCQKEHIYLEHIYIPEELRRKKYGSYLLTQCKQYMKEQGLHIIYANACPLGISDKGLREFYLKNGFDVSDYPYVIYQASGWKRLGRKGESG